MTSKLSAKELCSIALLGALMFASKLALAALPNIHMNALFIILAAVFFSWRSLYAVAVYVMLEGLTFGFALWWISYLYAWPLLAVVAVLMRKNDSALVWAVVAALHGLAFGALTSLPYLLIGGWTLAFSGWISGIPFDLLHGAGNFIIVLALYRPLKKALSAILNRQILP